jgi:hypothetical protein
MANINIDIIHNLNGPFFFSMMYIPCLQEGALSRKHRAFQWHLAYICRLNVFSELSVFAL